MLSKEIIEEMNEGTPTTKREILDLYLRYNGIIGHTSSILRLLESIDEKGIK